MPRSAVEATIPPVLATDRLQLRPFRRSDAPAIFDGYTQDPEVTRFLTWRPHQSLKDAEAYVEACLHEWESGRQYVWAITRPPEDRPLGAVALRMESHIVSLGYVLARPEWGQGYMTEAVQCIVDLALTLPGIYRVWAVCDVENAASARVMEKVGMQREGRLRRFIVHPNLSDEPRDVFLYARVR
jgi:[ribosomal protein S5]-alanine N-acetyltransferase